MRRSPSSRALKMRAGLVLLVALCGACARPADIPFFAAERPETAVDYTVELSGAEDKTVADLIEESLALYRRMDRGADSLAFLRRRARGDVETVERILRSRGYYGGSVAVTLDPGPPVVVRLTVDQGPRYTLARHDLIVAAEGDEAPPPLDAAALGAPVGAPAVAGAILRAEAAAVDRLKAAGWAYARRAGRDAIADPETATLTVASRIEAGRRHVFGPVAFEGAEGVERDYLDSYRTFAEGEPANPEKLVEFQRALIGTRLFEAGVAELPETPPPGAAAPVTVTLSEAPPRTVTAGLRYDTDAGPAARAGFEHRNLFGRNETATISALAGLEEQSLDSVYRRPQFRRPGQDLVLGLDLRRIDDDAFTSIGGVLSAGLERELTPALTVGAGGALELSRTTDADGRETASLLGLPLFAAYDDTDDLLDPTRGFRARVTATPFAGQIGGAPVAFGVVDGSASAYVDLTGARKHILAVRGRLGFAPAGDFDVVAANRRLYSGGGGSVRGYAERFIGPLDANGDPTGGLSVVEAGAELRSRVSGDIGFAAFVEAGSVSTGVVPTFDQGIRVAAGAGLRYYSPVGPLRVDVGVPVNAREVDDAFQVYVSIGQAF